MSGEQRREFEAKMIADILFTLSNWVDGGTVYRDKKQEEAHTVWDMSCQHLLFLFSGP